MADKKYIPEGLFLGATNVTILVPVSDCIAYYAPSNGKVGSGYAKLSCDVYVPYGDNDRLKQLSDTISGKEISKKTLEEMNFDHYVFVARDVIE